MTSRLFVDFCVFTCFYQFLHDVNIKVFCRSKQNEHITYWFFFSLTYYIQYSLYGLWSQVWIKQLSYSYIILFNFDVYDEALAQRFLYFFKNHVSCLNKAAIHICFYFTFNPYYGEAKLKCNSTVHLRNWLHDASRKNLNWHWKC